MKALIYITAVIFLSLQACSEEDKSAELAVTTAGTGDEPLPNRLVNDINSHTLADTVVKTKEQWKEELTSDEYRVLREEGTEIPFVNEYNDNKKKGIYSCAACGNPMFSSETKFDSGTGWPSFYTPISEKKVKEVEDRSMWMVRTEVECARCGSHIGHVFDDGPKPTGLRYCLNSIALNFEEK